VPDARRKETWPTTWAKPGEVVMISRPSFLVGAERSGTTLLRLMLYHHPRIAWSGEFEYAVDLLPGSPEGRWPEPGEYAEYLQRNRIFRLSHGLRANPELGDYRLMVDDFLEQTRAKQGADRPIIGATVHRHFDRLLWIWPDARFIHLVRDGRDVARSTIEMGWAGNYWTGVVPWIEAEELWLRVREGLEPGRWLDVSYESLIVDPERELGRVCEFLGVSFDPAMLEYHRDTTYGKPDPKLIQQWRRRLKPEELRLAEARIGPMLVERGYELSGQPGLEVSALRRRVLAAQDRWARARFRRKRYGWGDYLAEMAARRLGMRAWHDRVRERIQRRDQSLLR
jgi:hypothetical protein